MKCPRCQHANSSRARLCTACGARLAVRAKRQRAEAKTHLPVSRKAPKNEDARIHDLEKRLAESLEREKAAGEILSLPLFPQITPQQQERVVDELRKAIG